MRSEIQKKPETRNFQLRFATSAVRFLVTVLRALLFLIKQNFSFYLYAAFINVNYMESMQSVSRMF